LYSPDSTVAVVGNTAPPGIAPTTAGVSEAVCLELPLDEVVELLFEHPARAIASDIANQQEGISPRFIAGSLQNEKAGRSRQFNPLRDVRPDDG